MWPVPIGFEPIQQPGWCPADEAAFARGITRFRFGKLIVWFLIVVLIVAPVTIAMSP